MYTAIMVALTVSLIGTVISFLVATLIKGIFLSIKFRRNMGPKLPQHNGPACVANKF